MASGKDGLSDNVKTEMIKPGTLLLKCDPLVSVAYLPPTILCDTCLTMEATVEFKLKRCSFCRVVYYCNAKCQRKGWEEGHKYECPHMIKMTSLLLCSALSHELSWMPRLLLRLILKLQDGKDNYDELDMGGTKVKRRLEDLMSKLDNEEFGQYEDGMKAVDVMFHTVKAMLSDKPKIKIPDDAKLRKMAGMIIGNTIEICNNFFYRVGCGVYLGGSVFDHSCKPMAVPTFQGTTLYIHNIREIPKSLPISKVTISYLVNTLMPREERKQELQNWWYFDCKCEMCEAGEGAMDKEIRSLICSNKRCNAEIDFKDMRNPCIKCGHVMRKETLAKVLEAEGDAREQWKTKAIDFDLEDIEERIKNLKKNHFSDKHWLVLRFYDEAVTKATLAGTSSQNIEFMKKAYEFATKYIPVARRFFQPNEMELVRVLMELATACGALNKLDEAERWLREAKSMAEVVFGKDSYFIRSRIDEDLEFLVMANACAKMQGFGFVPKNIKA